MTAVLDPHTPAHTGDLDITALTEAVGTDLEALVAAGLVEVYGEALRCHLTDAGLLAAAEGDGAQDLPLVAPCPVCEAPDADLHPGEFYACGTCGFSWATPEAELRVCRECGCTDDDCAGCVLRTGAPCAWVEADLCSACEGVADLELRELQEADGLDDATWRPSTRFEPTHDAVAESLDGRTERVPLMLHQTVAGTGYHSALFLTEHFETVDLAELEGRALDAGFARLLLEPRAGGAS